MLRLVRRSCACEERRPERKPCADKRRQLPAVVAAAAAVATTVRLAALAIGLLTTLGCRWADASLCSLRRQLVQGINLSLSTIISPKNEPFRP